MNKDSDSSLFLNKMFFIKNISDMENWRNEGDNSGREKQQSFTNLAD